MIAAFVEGLAAQWQLMSLLELLAVSLGIAYIWLAAKESVWCWVAGFCSTALFAWLFWDVSLVMDAGLNVFYLVMSVVGFLRWRQQPEGGEVDVPIVRMSVLQHMVVLGLVVAMTAVSGSLLKDTQAAFPYMDSLTTWGGVLATVMVAYKVLGNWLWWMVLNTISTYLYYQKGMMLTCLLYGLVYQVMSVIGFVEWRRAYAGQPGHLR